jgi:hypothetical protein
MKMTGLRAMTVEAMEEAAQAGEAFRRALLVLGAALIVAAMMAASAMPAMAKVTSEKPCQNGGGPPAVSEGLGKNGSSSVFHGSDGACVAHFGKNTGKRTGGGC